ncbi:MAG: hypothetical protein WBF81_06885 [Thermoplasmata archaeon]
MGSIRVVVPIYRNNQFRTQVLVASVRHPVPVPDAAKVGADSATVPYSVTEKFVPRPLTDTGLARLLQDGEKVPKGGSRPGTTDGLYRARGYPGGP